MGGTVIQKKKKGEKNLEKITKSRRKNQGERSGVKKGQVD